MGRSIVNLGLLTFVLEERNETMSGSGEVDVDMGFVVSNEKYFK